MEAFQETLTELGSGFSELVHSRAMAIALKAKGLLVECEYPLTVTFRGEKIGTFEADLLVERLVLVEVKATPQIHDWMKAQILNYLRCAGGGGGLIVNFGSKPEVRRFVVGDPYNSLPRLSKHPVKNVERWLSLP